jgi:hypothetical protein
MTPILRSDLKDLPIRMMDLAIDPDRGYPVPWFVEWVNGKPEFRAMSMLKWRRAVRDKLCWVCGKKLGAWQVFVVGPMCGITRISAEPPSHRECARWSARFCPFLSRPHMVRRGVEDLVAMGGQFTEGEILRNPGVTLLWSARDFELVRTEGGSMLIHMGEPAEWEWWAEGRKATRAEVQESIRTGIPKLIEETAKEKGQMAELLRAITDFHRFVPAEEP